MKVTFFRLGALLLLACLAVTPARASVLYVAAGTVGGVYDSAEAMFTFGSGTITVTLDELSPYTGQSDNGLLSGIYFSVGPAVSSTTLSSFAYSGLANLSPDGTVTSIPVPNTTQWGTKVSDGRIYLGAAGTGSAGKPGDLIIGPNTSGNFNSYPSVNSSVKQHLPVVLGAATFVIDAPGVTPATTLSDVYFEFGTESLTLQGHDPPLTGSVPEPASALVMASGLVGMGLFARRKAAARYTNRRKH